MGPNASARQELHLTPLLVFDLAVTLTAYTAVNPRLFPLRVLLVPLALGSTWHLCTNFAFSDPWLNAFNFGICGIGVTMFMKLVEIASLDEPPTYDGRPGCTKRDVLCRNCLINTIGYLLDIRCLHWNNDSPCFIPQDTRGNASYLQFYTHTLYQFCKHLLIYDTLHAIIENIGTLGKPQGDTIFRPSLVLTRNLELPLPHPIFAAVPITFIVGLVIWHSMSTAHYLCTLLAAPLVCLPSTISPYSVPAAALKQEWPPLFDNPLFATSLRDFWSRRWHSVFRKNFWVSGGKPGSVLGGYLGALVGASSTGMRLGAVMGVFLMSGLLHDVGMWGMGRGMDFWRVTGYFLLQGVGLIVENALGLDKWDTKVDTSNGHAEKHANGNGSTTHAKPVLKSSSSTRFWDRLMTFWVIMWVVFPASMMIEAWLERGLGGVVIWPHALSPARAVIRLWNAFVFE